MKKGIFISFIALALLFSFAQMAMAYTVSTGSTYGPYQTGQGGEFTIMYGNLPLDLGSYSGDTINKQYSLSFQTFCLETGEYIYLNTTYTAEISSAAKLGGTGGVNGADPISIGTAYLYSQFAAGTLVGYDYGANRKSSADLLQKAIWYLEDEGGSQNIFTTLVSDKFTNPKADANGAYGVRALNLYVNGALRQDQLVVVPIPAAAWLLGSGLVGLVIIRRRMKK